MDTSMRLFRLSLFIAVCLATGVAISDIGPALIQATSIELGAAGTTDTTITRVSAGVVAVEGVNALTTGTGISVLGVQAFTSGSAATYTPTAGSKFFKVTCTGAGGEGGGSDDDGAVNSGGAGGGGEAGGTTIAWMTSAEMGANALYTIGAGGTGAASGTNGTAGNDGADTTFNAAGTHADLIAAGGDGGDGSGVAVLVILGLGGAAEGTATGGDVNIPGGGGHGGAIHSDGANAISGHGGAGGASLWGGGAAGVIANTSAGVANGQTATVPGSGGQGGISIDTAGTGGTGGDGAAGICIIEEFG